MKPVLPASAARWIDPPESPLPGDLASMLNLPELVLRILHRQGMHTAADARTFIDYHTYKPASPYELNDMEKGIERTLRAIKSGELIGVWGDFDVDGQTATATLVSALRKVGAKVVYHVPVRGPESHGIKLDVLQTFVKQGITLLITCDTGISEFEQVAWAQTHGIDVIITDHHTLPEVLPQAFAVINPQHLTVEHPLRPLPGVGVACKFAEALLDRCNQADASRSLASSRILLTCMLTHDIWRNPALKLFVYPLDRASVPCCKPLKFMHRNSPKNPSRLHWLRA